MVWRLDRISLRRRRHIRANIGRFTTLNAGGLGDLATRYGAEGKRRAHGTTIEWIDEARTRRSQFERTFDLIDRLDCASLTRMHLLALACCSLGLAFDLAEIALVPRCPGYSWPRRMNTPLPIWVGSWPLPTLEPL
jgi:hypothetical protein